MRVEYGYAGVGTCTGFGRAYDPSHSNLASMNRILLIPAVLLFGAMAQAQDWNQKADLAGDPRWGACGFSIGTKGYVALGTDGSGNHGDLWEWDQATNTWTPKADFPGGDRREGGAFSIGAFGYVTCGRTATSGTYYNDLWRYDPNTDSWTEKASLPAPTRSSPGVFVLNGKAYLMGGNPGPEPYYNDLWEYDPIADTWTQRADLPATGRSVGIAFSSGGKGYVGSGADNSSNNACKDFWEWDPLTDSWAQKADIPGPERRAACAFELFGQGYVGSGWDGTNYFTDFYRYDTATDTWTPIADFSGAGAYLMVPFPIGDNKAYVATGGTSGGGTTQLWEYAAASPIGVDEATTSSTITPIWSANDLWLQGWTSGAGDRFELYDHVGHLVASDIVRGQKIALPPLAAGAYPFVLSGREGQRTVWTLAKP